MIFNFTAATNPDEARSVMQVVRENRALAKQKRRGTKVDNFLNAKAPRLASRVRSILRRHGRNVARLAAAKYAELTKIDEEEIIKQILDHLALEDVSTDVIEEITPAIREAYREAHATAVAEVVIETGGEIVEHADEAAIAYAEQRAAELVTSITETTRDGIRGLVTDAVTEGWSANKLADAIEEDNGFSEYRSEMISRTELADAHVQGNLAGWHASGNVERKVWVTGAGCCDDCDELDGVEVDLDEDFDYADGPVDAPPAHPNAVLAGSTFAPYGELEEMVAANYHGRAVLLSTTQDKFLTIGPNHPILTRRGMVKAGFLKEGDDLVYDARLDDSTAGSQSNFEQMPFVEDAFETVRTLSRNSRVSTTGHDFHGDRIFCEGEVEVVKPANRLLAILDPCGIEKFRHGDLMRANVQALAVNGFGSRDLGLETVDLPASSGMGGGLSRHFKFLRLKSIEHIKWKGKAFDATTTTGIYNSGGFVVSNCRCDCEPIVREPEEENT